MTTRQEATRALYEGRLADVGDRNPYAGTDRRALAQLWMSGYMRMLRIQRETGPAMARYRAARRNAANAAALLAWLN